MSSNSSQAQAAPTEDGLVAVRIDNDWYLFARGAAPPGHEQVGQAASAENGCRVTE